MDTATLSRHALARTTQRGIRREVIDIVLSYGCRKRRHGASVFFMDGHSREAARDDLGRRTYAKIEGKLGVYVVVADDGTIVTCAHVLRRILN